MQLIKPDTKIDFTGVRRYAYGLSLALILITIVSLLIHRGPNYGVDFSGGILIQVKFQDQTTPKDIREGLKDVGMSGAVIQRFGSEESNEFLIRVDQQIDDLKGFSQEVEASLKGKFGEGALEVRRVEMVGPKVGKDLRQKALFAIFYAILFILIYISGRFEMKWLMSIVVAASLMGVVYLASLAGVGITWLILIALLVTLIVSFALKLKYALGAIVALIHDVTITVGIFSLFNLEITLTIVAALLTIVGYSLNDTIIVFDRIRENLRKSRRQPMEEVVNESINQTLSRTVLTSGTTLIVVICLLLLGGPVIADFALAMTVGIVVGTYSSIFVASPILLIWPPEASRASAAPAKAKNGSKKKK